MSPHSALFGGRWCEGLRVHAAREPVLIGFGWHALGVGRTPMATLRGAYRRAVPAASALAILFDRLGRAAPGRPVNILAHSLGGRVALLAFRASRGVALGRAVLMGPAEFRDKALLALEPHLGSTLEIFNLQAAENRLFDRLFARIIGPKRKDGVLGEGLCVADPLVARHWLDLDMGDMRLVSLLKQRGITLGPRRSFVDHWGFYRRAGALALHAHLLTGGSEWSVPELRRALACRHGDTVPEAPVESGARQAAVLPAGEAPHG